MGPADGRLPMVDIFCEFDLQARLQH